MRDALDRLYERDRREGLRRLRRHVRRTPPTTQDVGRRERRAERARRPPICCSRSRPRTATIAYSTGIDFPGQRRRASTKVVAGRPDPALRDNDWAGGAIAFADGLSRRRRRRPSRGHRRRRRRRGRHRRSWSACVRSRAQEEEGADAAAADAAALDQQAGNLLVATRRRPEDQRAGARLRAGAVRRRPDQGLRRRPSPTPKASRSRRSSCSRSSTTRSPRRPNSTGR